MATPEQQSSVAVLLHDFYLWKNNMQELRKRIFFFVGVFKVSNENS